MSARSISRYDETFYATVISKNESLNFSAELLSQWKNLNKDKAIILVKRAVSEGIPYVDRGRVCSLYIEPSSCYVDIQREELRSMQQSILYTSPSDLYFKRISKLQIHERNSQFISETLILWNTMRILLIFSVYDLCACSELNINTVGYYTRCLHKLAYLRALPYNPLLKDTLSKPYRLVRDTGPAAPIVCYSREEYCFLIGCSAIFDQNTKTIYEASGENVRRIKLKNDSYKKSDRKPFGWSKVYR